LPAGLSEVDTELECTPITLRPGIKASSLPQMKAALLLAATVLVFIGDCTTSNSELLLLLSFANYGIGFVCLDRLIRVESKLNKGYLSFPDICGYIFI